MSQHSKIEWTDASWTPIRARNTIAPDRVGWHCEKVSEACRNCYAEGMNRRLGTGLEYKPGNLDAVELFLDEKMLLAPLKWRKPRKIFVCSTTDLFGDWVKDEWLDRIFAVMALCPQHTFQCLTKRPKRMREYVNDESRQGLVARAILDVMIAGGLPKKYIIDDSWPVLSIGDIDFPDDITLKKWPLPNVWLGVTAENQEAADERIPDLLETPAAVRFVSVEPMLGPIDLEQCGAIEWDSAADPSTPGSRQEWTRGLVDQIIAGGESGPHARPSHPDWARSLRDQCAAAGVAYFHKQNGEWVSVLDRDKEDPDWRYDYSAAVRDRSRCFLNLAGGCGFHGERLQVMKRVGKRAAGRLLDGVEHSAFPARN